MRKIVDTQVVEKRVTKLGAEIEAVPKPNVIWFKNGEEIVYDDRIQAYDAKGGVYQLSIKNSRKDDTGVYICRAFNEIGQAECTAQLVIEMAPQFLKKLEKLDAVESCEAEWNFQLIGIPKPLVQFSRNNEDIDIEKNQDLYTLEEQEEDHVYTLRFKNVRKKDVGNWTCTASNSAGKTSCIAKLETLPLSAPKFLKELSDIRLPQDADNRIDVKVSGIPFPQIEWFKDSEKLNMQTQSSKYKTERDMNTGTLTLVILNCQTGSDSGLYKARIYNPGGECASEGNVLVKGYPPKFIEKPEKVYALSNQVATFATVVDGDPEPVITWAKGRNQVQEGGDIKIYYDEEIDVNIMEIANCRPKDAGTYQATATNEFGSDTAPVTLIITQNAEDVVDYKQMLKNREVKRRNADDDGPEWGKLKKAGGRGKDDGEGPEGIKLRHVEKDKKQAEEEAKQKPEMADRKPYEEKDFGPREKTDLETYEKDPRVETDEDDSDEKSKQKRALEKKSVMSTSEFTKQLIDLTVPEHKLGVFECAVSDCEAQVEWFYKGESVESLRNKKRFQRLSIGEFRRLAIRDCLIEDSGNDVACRWADLETTAKLFVTECPIIFKDGLKNQKVPKNTNAVLECTITNNLAPVNLVFKWKKNGEIIDFESAQNKDKYEFIIDGDKHQLVVKNFDKKDQANYEIYLTEPEDFEVSSQAKIELLLGDGEAEETIEDVTVSQEVTETEEILEDILLKNKPKQEPEPKFVYKLSDCHVRKHEQGVLEVKIPSSRIKVKWMKDGKPISSSSKYELEQGKTYSRLIINDSCLDDEGKYTVLVEDEEISAQMTVQGSLKIIKFI